MKTEEFCIKPWYLIASTAKVTQDLVNEYVDLEWDEALHNALWIQDANTYYDPAKSTKDISDNVATILQNTLDEKDNFYLKYAN